MSFDSLITVVKPPKETLATISYRRRGINPHPKLNITIPAKFCKKNKADCALWTFQVGTGQDIGIARIVPADVGVEARPLKAGGLSFHFGYVPVLGKDQAEKETMMVANIVTENGNGFQFKLPEWFKAAPPRRSGT